MVKCYNKLSKRGGDISVLVDFQNLIGQDHEKPDLTLKLVNFLRQRIGLGTREVFPQLKLF